MKQSFIAFDAGKGYYYKRIFLRRTGTGGQVQNTESLPGGLPLYNPKTYPKRAVLSYLETVSKPQRYLGGEYNEIRKDWEGAKCRFLLLFPMFMR